MQCFMKSGSAESHDPPSISAPLAVTNDVIAFILTQLIFLRKQIFINVQDENESAKFIKVTTGNECEILIKENIPQDLDYDHKTS